MEAVDCELKYSGAAVGLLLAACAASVILAFVLPLGGALRAAVVLYVLAHGLRACRSLTEVTALRLAVGAHVAVRGVDGAWLEGTVSAGGLALPALTVLRWRPAGEGMDRTLLLLPGMASREALRRIRVILLHG